MTLLIFVQALIMFKYISLILILFLILSLYIQCPTISQTDKPLSTGYAFSILYEYKNAIEKYEDYIKAYPKSSKQYIALNNKGNAHYHLGNFDCAVSTYEKALKSGVQSDYAKAIIHYNLANALIGMEEDNNIDKDKQEQNSNQPSTKRNKIFELKDERVIKEYEQAIQYKPFLEAYNNLALVCSSQEDGQETAIRYLEDALRIRTDKILPENTKKIAAVHFNLGNLMHQQIREKILTLCEENTSKETDMRDRTELPIQQKATQSLVHPATERLVEEIKVCKKDRECKKEAVRKWREALKQQPSFFARKHSMVTGRLLRPRIPPIDIEKKSKKREACIRINFDKFVDVIHEYETAIGLNPYFFEAYNNLGNLYLESSRFEEAIKHFRMALRLDRKAVFVHNNLGVAFFKSGQIKKGKEQYQIVNQLRENFLNLKLASFKVTKQSLDDMKAEGVPDDVLEGLKNIENYEVIGEDRFLNLLKVTIGEEQTVRYNLLILKHALKFVGQFLRSSAELDKGRMAEWGLGYSQSIRASSLHNFQPKGYDHTIPIMILWNINQFFGPVDIPPVAASEQIDSMLAYKILSEEKFNDLSLSVPVVRILAIFYKELVGGQEDKKFAKNVGTGFLIGKNGQIAYILTAYHNLLRVKSVSQHQVEYEPDEIVVQFFTPIPEARKASLVLRGMEDTGYSDLALLRIENVPEQIPLAKLSETSIPEKGEKAITVGHPNNERWQISTLKFDSVNMDETWSFYGEGIDLGYSGGPVYSLNGEVIAMLIEKKKDGKISRAIPVNEGEIKKILQGVKSK